MARRERGTSTPIVRLPKKAKGPLHGLNVDAFTPEKVDEIFKKVAEQMKELKRKERSLPDPIKAGTCAACQGEVIGTYKWVCTNPNWIGPGSSAKAFAGYHCSKCGIMYKFPPNRPEPCTEADEGVE